MTLKSHSRLFLMFVFFQFFGSGEPYDFCVRRGTSPICQRYLEVRKTLNLTTVMNGMEGKRSCNRRCGLSRQGDSAFHYDCFCDSLCGHYKDCCADFDLWCRRSPVPVDTNLTCRSVQGHTRTGFLMAASCPPTWKRNMIKQKCEEESSEFLRILPVTDRMNNTPYKNIFCAICNGVRNFKYWKVELPEKVVNENKNKTFKEILAQTTRNDWKFTNHDNDTKHIMYCKPQYPGCKSDTSLAHLLRMSNSQLQSVCNSYSFQLEVCVGSVQKIVYRNLHCILCDGKIDNITSYKCGNANSGLPSLTIAFDFAAHSSSSSNFNNKHSTKVVHYRCDADSAYDPFTDKCHSLDDEIITNNNKNVSTGQVKKEFRSPFLNSTCMELSGNTSRNVSLLANGSVVIRGRVRGDLKLEVIDNSSLICWNDTVLVANTSRGYPEKVRKESKLGVITVVGFTLSSLCLLFLLFTYAIFPELRTTPGKCVMSLSCALLLYMACHVPMMSSSYPVLCVGNAIVFHYSLLSVIGWLSVLAFDISKRFGSQAIETVAARAGSSQTTSRKRFDLLFFKYCAYSWGMPLAIVCVCIALDTTGTFRFAYGKGQYCSISTSHGIIAGVIAPVSAMFLFNLTALIKTIVGVHKLKKDTSIASNRSSQSSSAVLYLKLTCLFGLSWVLSIIFAFAQNIFVAYLTVSLNSCQGIFICLGFCFNKRVLTFYKTKLGIEQSKHSQKPSERSQTKSTSTRL